MNVILLVIDKFHQCHKANWKLDRILRCLICEANRSNCGINIVFICDFHYLLPFGGSAEALHNYYCIHWNQWINSSVLNNDHNLSEDRAYGEQVKIFSNRIFTKEVIGLINNRLLNDGCGNGGKLALSEDTLDIPYTC